MTFESISVVGDGRVGRTLAARLAARGVPARTAGRDLAVGDADLVLLAVPDRAIAEVAQALDPGPWVSHLSGATQLSALAPHSRRFSIHPLQTFTLDRGPEQLDGAWAAVSGETDDALEAGFETARLLGVEAFELADEDRPLYHAAALFVATFLVTIHEAAAELFQAVGAPPEALEPLLRRTIENGYSPTGPQIRADWTTIDAHLAAIHERRPELEPLYRALSDATMELTR
jgi:predicted short-subunit dehydrogenase-like oxidoreductase (DUF2520 family)